MTEDVESLERLAGLVRVVLETGDLAAFGELLDPNVRWGPPGDPSPPCQNRAQVLAWYEKGRQSGVRASVSETLVIGDKILVGLVVMGTEGARERGGKAMRWQVLTVDGGRVTDIVAFDDKTEAVQWIDNPAS